jgi:hypothetical protein
MKTHKRKKSCVVVKTAYAWQRVDGGWQQFLVRWWSDKSVSVDQLIRVYANASVCLHCLSHDVTYVVPPVDSVSKIRPELTCQACGITYKVLD